MNLNKIFKRSALSAALLVVSVPVYSGQIIGVQQGLPSPILTGADEYKNGFGGWDYGNVNVRIVDAETKQTDVVGKSFDSITGSYTAMTYGESFVSEVMDGPAGTVMGRLTGKDWPVGEPAGVRVITTDAIEDQSNGRPNSCILSTSYHKFSEDSNYSGPTPDDGYLDSANPNPTLCDSPFQTHKRFKVSALPTSIDDADGTVNNAIDIVFNLDTGATSTAETALRRYSVLQKLNNYTGSRLAGYKIELGFGVGNNFAKIDTTNTTLTDQLHLSVGAGDGSDFWSSGDLATFSAGLFGPADPPKHPNDGFFSNATANYPVTLTDAGLLESSGVLASNYTSLFGDWIPSNVAPSGVFYDDDNDPTTDAVLVAFWNNGQWLYGQAQSFAPVPDATLTQWADNSLYSVGVIEDLLNLGLSYMVEVGDVNTIVTQSSYNNFTIRMIPVVSTDTTAVTWGDAPTDLSAYASATGGTTTTSSGGSASFVSQYGFVALLLVFLGLGGWIVRNKMSK
ncbi:hypothetical protein THMIRHAM_10970 [Thiomicrorhabdus immobilis]|uniref:Uncharacterized protein n=1 Tax=Thiomicrorhabdus immobilis TaxID=2791037 RepID=A0ABN6CZL2_9GAMM|nr:choice-of-anchor F family protein [Thiomicrorhabdus immobilis]BCN93312.1 hypothetical protein THMIRHAM_10970 [Thiomicrorhabdus immobilis]